ncbi:MAG: polyketide synthase dehydratase domain-containing protein [Deltaproteobacteria bacterium]
MADLSRQIIESRFPFALSTGAYLRDHSFEGRAVYPAVEALITLARAVRSRHGQAALHQMAGAQFPRILTLSPAGDQQDIRIEMALSEGGISASLLTSVHIKNSNMSRTLEHARVTFVQDAAQPKPAISCRAARKLDGECIHVPAVSIYRELIPFGLSYQNIIGDLAVSQEGALADITGGSAAADDSLLGSPFALDAAMHAACVWGQRFTDIVAFPVGFETRLIHAPTRKGGSYFARITPVDAVRESLVFDAWIFDQNGILCESIGGLSMRDVTHGRMRPPGWIREGVWRKSS